MQQRGSVIAATIGFAVVVVGLAWFLIAFSDSPRSAHHEASAEGDVQGASQIAAKLDELSAQLANLQTGAGSAMRQPLDLGPDEIGVFFTDQPLPVDDPLSPTWGEARATTIPLEPQTTTTPMLDSATISEVTVRALTNGRQIAWLVSWDDPAADYHVDAARFCDAAGIQLPLTPNAAYTMGDAGFTVQILQWKALWQKDIDEGFQDVQDLHPNYWTDLYWFADGEFPYRVPDDFSSPESRDYFIGYRAGNPVSRLYRREPVQELIAEGYGTLTNQADSVSAARGVWQNGRWSVVFSRPMETNDEQDYQFTPGTRDTVAFAVWDGGAGNVGARKHHSQWVVFEVQQ